MDNELTITVEHDHNINLSRFWGEQEFYITPKELRQIVATASKNSYVKAVLQGEIEG